MNIRDWKMWLAIAVIAAGGYAVWVFAKPAGDAAPQATTRTQRRAGNVVADASALPPGIIPLRVDLLTPAAGDPSSTRNLFDFAAPPPPPPAPVREVPVEAPPPPPDRDEDGIPDASDNCPDMPNPGQRDIDRDGIGTPCETEKEVPPPPPLPDFPYTYIGTFGPEGDKLAAFSRDGEIVNVRPGQTFGGKFILVRIGVESVDIGFTGFPSERTRRIGVGQTTR